MVFFLAWWLVLVKIFLVMIFPCFLAAVGYICLGEARMLDGVTRDAGLSSLSGVVYWLGWKRIILSVSELSYF